ncbi:MAG: hypothetical protein U9O84_05395 [Chloroflexota bacterium]|nr:hypothetical protein [Chloroflexota bacterium]
MTLEWLRDLIIVICGIAGTLIAVLIAILIFRLYRQLKEITDSAKTTVKGVQSTWSFLSDTVVQPLIQITSLIQGIRQAINAVTKRAAREREDDDD